ncbi:MAG: reductive dehalogenase domain-containing protein, partial [Chloroflexota bacterium]|nr:reductive dehalogenase domain-containing protein [Chloroflexota bacterium]
FLAFAITSLREGHRRAALLATLFSATAGLSLALALFLSPQAQQHLAGGLAIALALFFCWLIWPFQRVVKASPPPNERVDERTILFARARLQPGTSRFKDYYHDHPEHLAPDNDFRRNPGLLNSGGVFYDTLLSASPEGDFAFTETLREAVDGPVAPERIDADPITLTHLVKSLAAYHGAVDCGVCELQPYHVYSHIGRGTGKYGAPVTLDHRYAIVFTVEMSHIMISAAPRMPAVMESARQYVEAAKIAVTLAAAIRALGYAARAHIDGNYRVIAPLVAKDAGLGEIGRMGLLMTPRLGPRVRLGVVTTDLPLLVDQAVFDPAVIDFCLTCQKCAAVCPAKALPFGERETYPDGTLRWKVNAENCYTYWTQIGTDCGRCIAVCPYSHPDTLPHNLIRLGVANSANFRKAAVAMDDLFYGRKPRSQVPPKWVRKINKN